MSTINGAYLDYNREKIIISLTTPYTGDTNIPINIQGVVSEQIIYTHKNPLRKTTKDPYFNPSKEKIQNHNAGIGS